MKLILLMLSFGACLLLTTGAVAHPGGTDAKGWHTNSKTGKKHRHKKSKKRKATKKKNARAQSSMKKGKKSASAGKKKRKKRNRKTL